MAGLDFELDIEQRLRGGDAITALERIEAAYNDAKSANDAFTREAVKATAALEKNAAALEDTKTKLLAALQAGDEKQVQKLTARFNELSRTEGKLKADAEAARSALDRQSKILQESASHVGVLKKQEDAHKTAIELADKRSEQHTATLQKLTGRVGDAGEKLASMGNDLGTVGTLTTLAASATIALVAAVVAAGAVFVAGAAALVKYAVGLRDVQRNQEQTLRALTQSNEAAAQLSPAFLNIEKGTGIAADRLVDMTRALTTQREQMGLARLSGNQLEGALYSLSVQEQALGDSSGTSQLIDQLNAGALSVEELGSRIDRKYSNVVEKKMLGLDQQLATLKANIAGIFSNINIEPILIGLSRLVSLFDTSTASGKAIQSLFESIFGPVVADNADRFFVGVERLFLKTELAALKFGIFFKKTWKEFNTAIDEIHLGPLGSLRDVLEKLQGPAEQAATWFVGMLNPITAMAQEVDVFSSAIRGIGQWLQEAYETGKTWVDKIIGFGDAIVDGLKNALTGGADKVIAAVSGMMSKALQAGKDAIGMHSPPRAYLEIGRAITETTAGAVDDGSESVGAAVEAMLTPPKLATGTGNSTTDNSVSVSGNHFHMYGGEGGPSSLDEFESWMVELLNRRNDQAGTEAPANG